MKKFLQNQWIIAAIIIVILAASSYAVYSVNSAGSAAATETPLQTAKARSGDIRVTVSGNGYSMAADRVDLGFQVGGVVAEINASVGQDVSAGDVLARLNDNSLRLQLATKELALQSLISQDALNSATIASLNAKDALSTSLATLQYLISRTVYNSEFALLNAQTALEEMKSVNASAEDISTAEAALTQAQKSQNSALYYYRNEYIPSVLKYEPDPQEISLARAQVRTAELAIEDANLYIQRLSSQEPCGDMTTVGTFTSQLNQACLDIDLAQLSLDGTILVAPFNAIVSDLNMSVGEVVTSSPVVTLETSEMVIQLYVEEADLPGIKAGLPVNITFDAYPDQSFSGVLERIDPQLAVIDGTPAVSIWSAVDFSDSDLVFLSGMTVEVEVVIGEAQNAVLVPSQALRELAPGSYAVFVVQADNSLKMTPVKVGLRDIANIQISSGLQAGDIVSTGVLETK